MSGSIKPEMTIQAAYRTMASFSSQSRAAQFAGNKNALDSAQNNLLTQLINKEAELTREVGKG